MWATDFSVIYRGAPIECSSNVVSAIKEAYDRFGTDFREYPCYVVITGPEATVHIRERSHPKFEAKVVIEYRKGKAISASEYLPLAEGHGMLPDDTDADWIFGLLTDCTRPDVMGWK